ncbi:MAG: hypothetical protein AB8F34_00190 [Akkermansiaceae bacterium]
MLPHIVSNTYAQAEDKALKAEAVEKPKESETKDKKLKARLFLANGDSLSGLPKSVDDAERLLFHSDSLRQTAKFPLSNVVSLHLDSWEYRPREETITRVELQPRFRENQGDTIMGSLHELTPESIKLKTWYGGVISLKRSMVSSLKIINSSPGNYHGPNSLAEWTVPKGDDSWEFSSGALVSQSSSSIGRDMQLSEKTHVSFTAAWKNAMRFKVRLYSNDIKSGSASAYYEVNINRSYAYLQTRGKNGAGRGRMLGGARWRQIQVNREDKLAEFDFFVDRKTGVVTLYINGAQACVLQSQSPDPIDLGTGLEFIAEQRYPVEISDISVTPWNGTSLPGRKTKLEESENSDEDGEEKAPHKILLSNGDEVPGTVGKVEDGKMIVETEFTPIKIPIKRIKSLSLGDKREEPKKYRGDIRAWLHEGGFITLRLESFKDGKINGFNQATGNVSLKLDAFNRIDFLIYDAEANELRKELR